MIPNLLTSGVWGAMPPNGVPRGKAPWSAAFACLLLLVGVVPSACAVPPEAAVASSTDSSALQVGERFHDGAAPPSVPLREKLGAHLLALSTSYADGGSQAVRTYARSAGLDLPEQRVSVQVLAASEQDVAGLEQRILEAGGSVQSTFENSIFATLPVPALAAFARREGVWRMDMQRAALAPAEVVDLETEHGGRDAK